MAQIRAKTRPVIEFGDFQTPDALACLVVNKLCTLGLRPRSILEPTCGRGAFVLVAASMFLEASAVLGVEINPHYVERVTAAAQTHKQEQKIRIHQGNFFSFQWAKTFAENKGPWLILGNPPWVTSSDLGSLASNNLPVKSNFHKRPGIEAITGKSNFDISEWMLLQYLEWLNGDGTIAVLCKTAVARKILRHAWKHYGVSFSHIYKINAMALFGAAVDACLFVLDLKAQANNKTCEVYDSIEDSTPSKNITFCKNHLVTDHSSAQLEFLWGPDSHYIWRSGVKHDCARVMELFPEGGGYRNGLREGVQLEETFLYPMLKGSDIGNGRIRPRGAMIITQEFVGQETDGIASMAPKTWDYLNRHRLSLDKRGSVIYRNKPSFSIFGVGAYTFSPWKLAVSSFYKKLLFVSVGPADGKPVVFDDTVYFLPCASESEAHFLEEILHSDLARQFFESMVHWSDKRPLTIDLLKRLSLAKLAAALNRASEYEALAGLAQIKAQQSVLGFAS